MDFGVSVALSADGNTALIGADSGDGVEIGNSGAGIGSAYVFTRTNGSWTRSQMLLPTPDASYGYGIDGGFGDAVALSADGSTALIGGNDGNSDGEFWVFTRSGGGFSQQAGPLQSSDEAGYKFEIDSVALSSNGSTALIGSAFNYGTQTNPSKDQSATGTAWVWTRTGSSWSQQGPALTPTNWSASPEELYGQEVSLSADGNTALVGAGGDGSTGYGTTLTDGRGAGFVFTRAGSTWTQQAKITAAGVKLLGGYAVLSANGSEAVMTGGGQNGTEPGFYEFDRSGSTWTLGGAPFVGSNETDASALALSGDGSTAVSGDSSTGDGIGGAFAFAAKYVTVSGFVYGQACGEDSCSQKGIGGITVLVTGTANNGTSVSETDETDAEDGSWSVLVPAGSYTAGPSDDGETFSGPAFDPPTLPVTAASAAVTDVNFTECTPSSADANATGGSADAGDVRRGQAIPRANGSQFTEAMCKTAYTVTLSARIPQKTIVDPSLAAPYQLSGVPGNHEGYHSTTNKLGVLLYRRFLDSALETYPKYPACFDKEKLKELASERYTFRWYSYISGGSLGSITVPLLWNQWAQKVYYNGPVSSAGGTLTRTWVYFAQGSGKHHSYEDECHVTAQISPLFFALPGGNDPNGQVAGNAFTIIALWNVPFEPSGAEVAPDTSAEAFLKSIVGDELGENVVKAYESLPWFLHFSFGYALLDGGVQALEGGAKLATKLPSAVKAATNIVQSLEVAGNIAEKLHNFHTVWDVSKWPGSLAGAVAMLGKNHYPLMGAVIRGNFLSTYTSDDPKDANRHIKTSTLALSVKSTSFPDITLQLTRAAKSPNNFNDCPVQNGPLPWANTSSVFTDTACLVTSNPFTGNPADMIVKNTKSYTSGKGAVESIVADTSQLSAIGTEIKDQASLQEGFGNDQGLVAAPSCTNTGVATNRNNTICWVFRDGRP